MVNVLFLQFAVSLVQTMTAISQPTCTYLYDCSTTGVPSCAEGIPLSHHTGVMNRLQCARACASNSSCDVMSFCDDEAVCDIYQECPGCASAVNVTSKCANNQAPITARITKRGACGPATTAATATTSAATTTTAATTTASTVSTTTTAASSPTTPTTTTQPTTTTTTPTTTTIPTTTTTQSTTTTTSPTTTTTQPTTTTTTPTTTTTQPTTTTTTPTTTTTQPTTTTTTPTTTTTQPTTTTTTPTTTPTTTTTQPTTTTTQTTTQTTTAAAATTPDYSSLSCGAGWTKFQASCYYFYTAMGESSSFSGAQQFCGWESASAVVPNTAAENAYIKGQIATQPAGQDYWVGIEQVATGVWQLSDGSTPPYTDWASGVTFDAAIACAKYDSGSGYQWRPMDCASLSPPYPYLLCEKPAV